MEVSYEFQWNDKVRLGLDKIPDDILYEVARQTLDRSYALIPKSNLKNHAGTLRRSSISGGVRGSSGDYYIGSYTTYASSVWKMTNVNWTTPGTNNKWFARTLDRYGTTIIDSAINKSWRKDM
jgi:hypothetical protein